MELFSVVYLAVGMLFFWKCTEPGSLTRQGFEETNLRSSWRVLVLMFVLFFWPVIVLMSVFEDG